VRTIVAQERVGRRMGMDKKAGKKLSSEDTDTKMVHR